MFWIFFLSRNKKKIQGNFIVFVTTKKYTMDSCCWNLFVCLFFPFKNSDPFFLWNFLDIFGCNDSFFFSGIVSLLCCSFFFFLFAFNLFLFFKAVVLYWCPKMVNTLLGGRNCSFVLRNNCDSVWSKIDVYSKRLMKKLN